MYRTRERRSVGATKPCGIRGREILLVIVRKIPLTCHFKALLFRLLSDHELDDSGMGNFMKVFLNHVELRRGNSGNMPALPGITGADPKL